MYFFFKRLFDIISSVIVLVILFPLLFIISVWILLDSKGGIFYTQTRIGKDGKPFKLLKFRSMRINSDHSGQLTVGDDKRVTRSGKFIRRFKIDEFPQLINIIGGKMSIVGPRPEVPRYVALYSEEQRKVLSVLPGLTDYATLQYFDEQKLLGKSSDPEKTYVEQVMPAKLELNLQYAENQSLGTDIKLIFKTIIRIFQ